MLMAAAYRLLQYQYQLRVPCSQGMCTAQQSAEGKHQNTTLHRKGLHLLRQALMWSINSLVDDGLPDRIPTGLPKTLLPLAAVLDIHDINISHAQMADNTLRLHPSLLNQFFSIFQLYFTMKLASSTNESISQWTELKTEPWADFTHPFCLLL